MKLAWLCTAMGCAADEVYDGTANVDISADPITSDYDKINTIHSIINRASTTAWTAMGDGILKGRTLLLGDPNVANDHGFRATARGRR